jgi:predicted amidophosphoribosyltransferase
MDQEKCGEKGCPFPAVPGKQICQYHDREQKIIESLGESRAELLFNPSVLFHGDIFNCGLSVIGRKFSSQQSFEWNSDGRCIRCGAQRDRDGKTCRACRDELTQMYKALKHRRDDRGLCPNCGAPRVKSEKHCSACLDRFRRRYRGFIARGLCKSCRGLRDRGDRILCLACRMEWAADHQRRVRSREASGKCNSCGRPRDRRNKRLCSICARSVLHKAECLYSHRRANGLCASCGHPTGSEACRCPSCKSRVNELRKKKSESGLCVTCGNPNTTSVTRCRSCSSRGEELRQSRQSTRRRAGECIQCRNPSGFVHARCLNCRLTRRSRRVSAAPYGGREEATQNESKCAGNN